MQAEAHGRHAPCTPIATMDNANISRALTEMADILELTGGNVFKVRAYRQAAQVVDWTHAPRAGA